VNFQEASGKLHSKTLVSALKNAVGMRTSCIKGLIGIVPERAETAVAQLLRPVQTLVAFAAAIA
jgi:hypothetical protein